MQKKALLKVLLCLVCSINVFSQTYPSLRVSIQSREGTVLKSVDDVYSCQARGSEVRLTFDANGAAFSSTNQYPYTRLKVKLHGDFTFVESVLTGISSLQSPTVQTGSEGKEFIIVQVKGNVSGAFSSESLSFRMAAKNRCSDLVTDKPDLGKTIEVVTVVPVDAQNNEITNPANYLVNKLTTYNYKINTNLVPLNPNATDNWSIIDGERGKSISRTYRFAVDASNTVFRGGTLVIRCAYPTTDLTFVKHSLLLTSSTGQTLPTTGLIANTQTVGAEVITTFNFAYSGAAANTILDIEAGTTLTFKEDLVIAACLANPSDRITSQTTIQRYCGNYLPNNLSAVQPCSTYFGGNTNQVISRGADRDYMLLTKRSVKNALGQEVLNASGQVDLSKVASCFDKTRKFTNEVEYTNTTLADDIALNYIVLQKASGVNDYNQIPLEDLTIKVTEATGAVSTYIFSGTPIVYTGHAAPSGFSSDAFVAEKGYTAAVCSSKVSQNQYPHFWEGLCFESKQGISNPAQNQTYINYYIVNKFNGLSGLTIKKGAKINITWSEYQTCEQEAAEKVYGFMLPGLNYQRACAATVFNTNYQTLNYYDFRNGDLSVEPNTFKPRMAGHVKTSPDNPKLNNGDYQAFKINVKGSMKPEYFTATLNSELVFRFMAQDGITLNRDIYNTIGELAPFASNQALPQLTLELPAINTTLTLTASKMLHSVNGSSTVLDNTVPIYIVDKDGNKKVSHYYEFKWSNADINTLANQKGLSVTNMLTNIKVSMNLQAYCPTSGLPKTFFEFDLAYNYDASSACTRCLHLIKSYQKGIEVTCPGCLIPGMAFGGIQNPTRLPQYRGYTDANADGKVDDINENPANRCAGCDLSSATYHDEMELIINSSLPDGESVNNHGYTYSAYKAQTNPPKKFTCAHFRLVGDGIKITQLSASIDGGVTYKPMSLPMSLVEYYGNKWNAYVAKSSYGIYDQDRPTQHLLNIPVSFWANGMNEYQPGASNIKVKVQFKIISELYSVVDTKEYNIQGYFSDLCINQSTGDASVEPYVLTNNLATSTIISGLEYWCERDAFSIKYIPKRLYFGPDQGFASTGGCTPSVAYGHLVVPDKYNFTNEYRVFDVPDRLEYFVPTTVVTPKYIYFENSIRLGVFQRFKLDLSQSPLPSFVAKTTNADGTIYVLDNLRPRFKAIEVGVTVNNTPVGSEAIFDQNSVFYIPGGSMGFSSYIVTDARCTSTLAPTDKPDYLIYKNTNRVFNNANTGNVVRPADFAQNSMLMYFKPADLKLLDYLSYTPTGLPTDLSVAYKPTDVIASPLGGDTRYCTVNNLVLNKSLGNINVTATTSSVINISQSTFSFTVRVNNNALTRKDAQNNTVAVIGFEGVKGTQDVKNFFVNFPVLPEGINITSIQPLAGSGAHAFINYRPQMFSYDQLPAGAPYYDFTITGTYTCNSSCTAFDYPCYTGAALKLQYGWGCALPQTMAEVSNYCNIASLNYTVNTTAATYTMKAFITDFSGATKLSNSDYRETGVVDFCINSYLAKYEIDFNAIGKNKVFSFQTTLPVGFDYDAANPQKVMLYSSTGKAFLVQSNVPSITTNADNTKVVTFTGLTLERYADWNFTNLDGAGINDFASLFFTFPIKSTCNKVFGRNDFGFKTTVGNYCGTSKEQQTAINVTYGNMLTWLDYSVTIAAVWFDSYRITVTKSATQTATYASPQDYVDLELTDNLNFPNPSTALTKISDKKYRFPLANMANGTTKFFDVTITKKAYDEENTYELGIKATVYSQQSMCTPACPATKAITSNKYLFVQATKYLKTQIDPFHYYGASNDYTFANNFLGKQVQFKGMTYLLGGLRWYMGTGENFYDVLAFNSINSPTFSNRYEFRIRPCVGPTGICQLWNDPPSFYGNDVHGADEEIRYSSLADNGLGYYRSKEEINMYKNQNTFFSDFGAKAITADANYLYIGGNFSSVFGKTSGCYTAGFWVDPSTNIFNIAKFDGTTWTQVGNGLPNTVNQLEAGGGKLFAIVNAKDFYMWNGSVWTQYALPNNSNFASDKIMGMKYQNNLLYIYGNMGVGAGNCGGQYRGIVSFDPNTLTFGTFPYIVTEGCAGNYGKNGPVNTTLWYNGRLVIAGDFRIDERVSPVNLSTSMYSVAAYDATVAKWVRLGTGLDNCNVTDLEVYEGQLYASLSHAPYLKVLASNGAWKDALKFQRRTIAPGPSPSYNFSAQTNDLGISDLSVIDNKLFGFGRFRAKQSGGVFSTNDLADENYSVAAVLDALPPAVVYPGMIYAIKSSNSARNMCEGASCSFSMGDDFMAYYNALSATEKQTVLNSITWSVNGQNYTGVLSTPAITFTAAGIYDIYAFGNFGTTKYLRMNVGVNVSNLEVLETNTCQNQAIRVRVQGDYDNKYLWSSTNTGARFANSYSMLTDFTVSNTNTTPISVTATSPWGCTKTLTITPTILSNPYVSLPTITTACASGQRTAITLATLPLGDNYYIKSLRSNTDIQFVSGIDCNYNLWEVDPSISTSIPVREYARTSSTSSYSYVYHLIRIQRANGCYLDKTIDEKFINPAQCAAPNYRSEEEEAAPASYTTAYPNPFEQELTLSTQGKVLVSYKVLNLSGQVQDQKVLSGERSEQSEQRLSTRSWSPGLYLLKVQYQDGTEETLKVSKQ